MSIIDVLEDGRRPNSSLTGIVVGIVVNNKDDPEKLGRVKVKIPRLSDEESNWARVVTFMGGNNRGAFFLPEVDDEVLVAFEYGDINTPYVIGALWNGKDKPPITNDDGENNIRMIKSRSGHVIKLDDKSGEEKIVIIDANEKNSIVIDMNNEKISIKSNKDIEISASSGDIGISAPSGKVKIDAKDIELSAASGNVKIDAKDIQAKSTISTSIEATTGLDLKASGNLNIKGAMVNIN